MFGRAKHPKILLGLCIFTVIAIVAVVVFESSPNSQPNGAADPTAQLRGDFAAHLESIHSMNVSAIEQAYESNATVQFTVPGTESSGNHTGPKSIGILFAADIFPNFALPKFSKINSTVVNITGGKATVDSSFIIGGFDSDATPRSANVIAHTLYVKDGRNWLISFESWSLTFRAGGQP